MDEQVQILKTKVNGLVHELSIALDRRAIDGSVSDCLKEVQRTVQVKGFRRGRAPLNVVRRYHGRRIVEAVVDRVAIGIARKHIAENELRPVGRPVVRIGDSGIHTHQRIHFTLAVEVFPHVIVNSIDGFAIENFRLKAIQGEIEGERGERAKSELCHKILREHLNGQVLDRLAVEYDFVVPTEMVKREYQRIKSAYRDNVEKRISPKLDAQLHELAERRIRLAILFVEIGRCHDIHVPREEVVKLVELHAEREREHGEEIVEYYLQNPSAMAELQSALLERRVIELILERAEIREREVTADELLSLYGTETDGCSESRPEREGVHGAAN